MSYQENQISALIDGGLINQREVFEQETFKPNTMKPIIYLKSIEHGINVLAFNPNNLTVIGVCASLEAYIEKYDTIEDYEFKINLYTSNRFSVSTKEDFDAQFIAFGKNLNELSKEL